MATLPTIALTMGDPAGIGPEIVARCAADPEMKKIAKMLIYGCPDIIAMAAEKFCGEFKPEVVETGELGFHDFKIGVESAECGLESRNAVIRATKDAIGRKVHAIVTAPVNKASVNLSGIPFTGHTELIAELCGIKDFAMMQSAGNLRVVFVTTHIPLKDVASAITEERIIETAILLNNAIKDEGVQSPQLAAAAINPHAGENGYMGREDEDVVKPALRKLRQMGVKIDGPFPPDTLFISQIREKFDGLLSMYHDQGHIPFKMLAFDRGVNSTLGLPIVRTSVDHGTAFGIAWRGVADLGSMKAAIRLAAKRAVNRFQLG